MGAMCCGKSEKYADAEYGDPNYTGPPMDDKLAKGPMEERSCTDIICCLVFIGWWVVMAYIGYISMTTGEPETYLAVWDGGGVKCGLDAQAKEHKYLYFWTPASKYLNRTTCVKTCPIETNDIELAKYYTIPYGAFVPEKSLECLTNTLVPQCYGISPDMLDVNILTNYASVFLVYPSIARFGRFCVPAQMNSTLSGFYSKVSVYVDGLDAVNFVIADVQLTWPLILASAAFALFTSFFFMVVMKCCAAPITWMFIILVQLLMALISYLMYNYAINTYQLEMDALIANGEDPGYNYYEYLAYGCMAFTVTYFIGICCLYTKIRIAIRIMETAADFVTEVVLIVLVPPITATLIITWCILWVYTFVYVVTTGTYRQADDGLLYSVISYDYIQKASIWAYVFGGLWGIAFICACNQFVIASAACLWYFSPRDPESENDKLVERAVSRSVYRLFRYHLGSLAFGSFLVAAIQTIRLAFLYLHKQMKEAGVDKQSKIMHYIMAIGHCLLACFERIIKFINKNAYIQIAITSNCFCIACKDAFYLIFRNAFLFTIVAGIGEVFIWIGRIFITVITIICAFCVLEYYDEYRTNLHYWYVPLGVIAVVAGLIAYMFMSVWAMAADAILQCFCVDKEVNSKGGEVLNTYCPNQLLDFVQEDHESIAEDALEKRKFQQEEWQRKREADPNYGKSKCCC